MTTDKVLWHTHITTNAANLILKEEFEWLAELEIHLFRKTTYIVVGFDDLTRVVDRLNNIWVDSTLTQPFCIRYLLCFLIEYLDKIATNNLSFLLWVSHTRKIAIETSLRIHAYHIETKALIVAEHIFELIFAKQSVINKDTCELTADSTVEKHCCDGTIHATRERENNTIGTNLLAKLSYRCLNKVSRSPVLSTMASVKHKRLEFLYRWLFTFGNMEYWDARAELTERVLKHLRLFYSILIARENKTNDIFVVLWILVVRKDLAECIQLTNTAADDLSGF